MSGRKRILFVEDDPNLQRIMIKWLRGYEVSAFDNADDAYEFAAGGAAKNPVDLFILDIMLKKAASREDRRKWVHHTQLIGHGVQLGHLLRKLDAYRETPIIFLSAKLTSPVARETLGQRVQAICYEKPVPYKALQARVEEILGHADRTYWQKFARMIGLD